MLEDDLQELDCDSDHDNDENGLDPTASVNATISPTTMTATGQPSTGGSQEDAYFPVIGDLTKSLGFTKKIQYILPDPKKGIPKQSIILPISAFYLYRGPMLVAQFQLLRVPRPG